MLIRALPPKLPEATLAQRAHLPLKPAAVTLQHAFGFGYRRLDWKCHHHNERSRQSALRMGFTFEGIQENHMIVKDRSRDTAWFHMLDTEWPEVRACSIVVDRSGVQGE